MSETVNAGCAGPAAPAVRLRRVIDVLGAGTAIFVSLPILLVIALAVWIEGGRPILYSQLRLGLNGAPFRMYKFRKFRADCDDRGSPLTMVNDNRMTTIGGLLAAFKLDELPQLWNILRGDMSFVGPRPGPCQVLFRHENELFPPDGNVADFYREVLFPAKAKIDLAYYSNRTVTSDLRWIVQAGWIAVGEPLLNRMRRPRPESQSGIAPTGGSVGANLFQK
jgi:lipopolysaccharide/colanic/teichoic acid biosynthesis glycosyltransferase